MMILARARGAAVVVVAAVAAVILSLLLDQDLISALLPGIVLRLLALARVPPRPPDSLLGRLVLLLISLLPLRLLPSSPGNRALLLVLHSVLLG